MEETASLISTIVSSIQDIYASYGWYIFGVVLVSLYMWSRFKPSYYQWRKEQEERDYAAQLHKNPDLFRARQEAIEAARLRMQEEHDRAARLQAEKVKERDDAKREEWIARQVGSTNQGHRLAGNGESTKKNESQPSSSKKSCSSFKPEYNPLMGSGGSGGYRPPKRGCPGGGCGKK